AGDSAKLSDPAVPAINAAIMTGFSEYFSTQNPAGIDISPYAMKKEKGRRAAAVRLTWKLLMMSGTIGPKILVKSDITKNVKKTRPTIYRFRLMRLSLCQLLCRRNLRGQFKPARLTSCACGQRKRDHLDR